MLKEILEKIETEETPEVNESNYTYKWVGGSDDYKSIAEIEKIISEYNFYSNRIDNGGEHRDAVSKNKKLW
ncbi:MAG: hypothetical protein KAI79_06000, partial [Bacteroidales bacterium]|nr:hypothetical protein [Bacteroidales bacterium]